MATITAIKSYIVQTPSANGRIRMFDLGIMSHGFYPCAPGSITRCLDRDKLVSPTVNKNDVIGGGGQANWAKMTSPGWGGGSQQHKLTR